eukprot:SAG11_NODE_7123_length_1189_cov_27.749541_1_plen_232_part_10
MRTTGTLNRTTRSGTSIPIVGFAATAQHPELRRIKEEPIDLNDLEDIEDLDLPTDDEDEKHNSSISSSASTARASPSIANQDGTIRRLDGQFDDIANKENMPSDKSEANNEDSPPASARQAPPASLGSEAPVKAPRAGPAGDSSTESAKAVATQKGNDMPPEASVMQHQGANEPPIPPLGVEDFMLDDRDINTLSISQIESLLEQFGTVENILGQLQTATIQELNAKDDRIK